MRKAIIVTININELYGRKKKQSTESSLEELNQHLAKGWKVVHSFAMSGTGHTLVSATVVILEKD